MSRLALVMWILALCLAWVDGASVSSFSRVRRSVLQLAEMVDNETGQKATSFLNYGHWCGLGGNGEPVDAIDRCCRRHDFCYDDASEIECDKRSNVYFISYQWHIKEKRVVCDTNKDTCASAVCDCDSQLTHCLRNHLSAFNGNNRHKRLQYTLNK